MITRSRSRSPGRNSPTLTTTLENNRSTSSPKISVQQRKTITKERTISPIPSVIQHQNGGSISLLNNNHSTNNSYSSITTTKKTQTLKQETRSIPKQIETELPFQASYFSCCSPPDLQQFQELPNWRQDNDFLHGAYRQTCEIRGYCTCIRSIFQWHNETLNIWTHIFATVVAGLCFWFAEDLLVGKKRATDVFLFRVFFAGSFANTLFSSVFHIYSGHGLFLAKLLARFDYCGISLMICGCAVPPLWIGFMCYPYWQVFYVAAICVVTFFAIVLGMFPAFSSPAWRTVRTWFFVGFGSLGIFPMPHFISIYGEVATPFFVWVGGMAFFYLGGAFLYARRVPERIYPGRVDHFGSHVIWHFCTMAAAYCHFNAVLAAFDFNNHHHCLLETLHHLSH